jgi:hypothetical protein
MRTRVDMSPPLARGLAAGGVGTLALSGFALLRNAALGHPPPYATRRIASRLLRPLLRRPLRPPEALAWGLGLRCVYGPLLGLAWACLPLSQHRSPARGLLLGLGVWAFELLSLPLLRATSPASTWSRGEHLLLFAQTSLFGIVTQRAMGGHLPR